MAAWSVDDLSIITQLLIDKLNTAVLASPQWISQHFLFEVSGLMPAVSRTQANTVLNLYLLHVGRDPFWRNTPVQGSLAQQNSTQPLSLNLSYLLTAYSENNWALEQLLMSIAFEYFHANPIYQTTTLEFTITIESDTIEEMSRLWQAITAPIRLSALFRVAIVFLGPPPPPITDSRLPVEVNLSVAPDLNMPAPSPLPEPQLYELAAQIEYRVPPGSAFDPDAAPGFTPSQALPTAINTPPVVMAGQTLRVRGSGLNQPDAAVVYLSSAAKALPATVWPLSSVKFTRVCTAPLRLRRRRRCRRARARDPRRLRRAPGSRYNARLHAASCLTVPLRRQRNSHYLPQQHDADHLLARRHRHRPR